MKKIYQFFSKISGWLASFGVDRYLHLLAGLFIAFFVAIGMSIIGGESTWTCVFFSMMVTAILGIIKEVLDQNYTDQSDGIDFLFTCIGGIIGCGLWLL
jgi:hypothetical protein